LQRLHVGTDHVSQFDRDADGPAGGRRLGWPDASGSAGASGDLFVDPSDLHM
jgi:hypothetical protein